MKGIILALLGLSAFAAGDALDDAVNQWAKKIASHLGQDEIAHVTWQTEAADPGATSYLNRAKPLLARALQRRLRNPQPVEITTRLSHSLKSYLFIAEMHRENEQIVEIVSLPLPNASAPAVQGLRIDRHFLWDQEAPILDLFVSDGEMLVLDTFGVTRYEQRDSKWQKSEAFAMEISPVRDLRGRLTTAENSAVAAEVPGQICRGQHQPSIALECQPGGRFTVARNTISEPGWPEFFNSGEIGGDRLVTEADGRTYVYDPSRKQLNVFTGWGDFAVVSNTCAGPKVLVSDAVSDSLAVFDWANHKGSRVSDPSQTPGPMTALWASGATAMAVVRNRTTNRYEAYSIDVDCGH